jgi:hypothetical protein
MRHEKSTWALLLATLKQLGSQLYSIGSDGTVHVPIDFQQRSRFGDAEGRRIAFRNARIAEAKLWVASRGDI